MKQGKILFILICFLQIQQAFSQNFNRPNDWKKFRREVAVQVGAAGFLGDLGGLDQEGTDYSPVDLELAMTRPAVSVAYRYKFSKNFNIHSSFNYLLVAGDDKLTKDPFRNNRNLNFKSNIFEFSTRFEVSLFVTKIGHRYGIKKTMKRRHKAGSNEFILFAGVGGFYFNPKGKNPLTGEYESLYILHTEGQGLANGPKQYKKVGISIPVGIAWRKTINKYWCIGLEVNFRKTFTDYIDDVSTVYYNKQELQAAYGTKAVLMADPSLGDIPGATYTGDGVGQQRGDKEKDSYMSAQITVGRFFPPKRKKTKLRSKF